MRPSRHPKPSLRIVSGSVVDGEIVAAWHEVRAGDLSNRIVDGVMREVVAELSTFGVAVLAGAADVAILRAALHDVVVGGLRKNLIRRLVQARERPELLMGKTPAERLVYLIAGPGDDL